MATMPSIARVMFEGQKRSFDPDVERDEMERGVAKQRIRNTQVTMKQALTLYFSSIEDATAFDDWYFDEIRRIGWFSMIHPYTGKSITARFENGAIGDLVPDEKTAGDYRLDAVLEYLR